MPLFPFRLPAEGAFTWVDEVPSDLQEDSSSANDTGSFSGEDSVRLEMLDACDSWTSMISLLAELRFKELLMADIWSSIDEEEEEVTRGL